MKECRTAGLQGVGYPYERLLVAKYAFVLWTDYEEESEHTLRLTLGKMVKFSEAN